MMPKLRAGIVGKTKKVIGRHSGSWWEAMNEV